MSSTATSVTGKYVKQFRQTGKVNKLKGVRRSTFVTEFGTAEVTERLSASLHKPLRKLAKQIEMP
jgi:hypothetical protein